VDIQNKSRAQQLVNILLHEGEDNPNAWIAVDLDGTLARYDGWKGSTHIGSPVPAMVARLRRWVGHGKKVKIFTARADDEKSVNAIKKWLKDNELPDLEITNIKDKDCVKFYDDRAVHVKKNTGKIGEGLRTLRQLQAMDDNQLYLCNDQSVDERHRLQIPFECGCRQWHSAGIVVIEFYSNREKGIMAMPLQTSDYAAISTLEPVPGKHWNFDDIPSL